MFDFASFLPRAVMQGIPLLYGSTGEILTEKSGNRVSLASCTLAAYAVL